MIRSMRGGAQASLAVPALLARWGIASTAGTGAGLDDPRDRSLAQPLPFGAVRLGLESLEASDSSAERWGIILTNVSPGLRPGPLATRRPFIAGREDYQ
jgi:hypothetical protein